jgi:hypothetical protein
MLKSKYDDGHNPSEMAFLKPPQNFSSIGGVLHPSIIHLTGRRTSKPGLKENPDSRKTRTRECGVEKHSF